MVFVFKYINSHKVLKALLNKYLFNSMLSTYYVASTVLGSGHISENNRQKVLPFYDIYLLVKYYYYAI